MQADTKVLAKPQTETEKLFAIDKPSLENLSYALRHPETWPKGFVWDFGKCDSCAMGLAHELWSQSIPAVGRSDVASVMAREFALPYEEAAYIFLRQTGKTRFLGVIPTTPEMDEITPEMVADQIDRHLAGAK